MTSSKSSFFARLKHIDLVNTLFFFITPIAFGVSLYLHLKYEGFAWMPLIAGIVLYYLMGFSITLAYHRLFSHKSFKASFPVRLFFLLTGAGAFQQSAIKWASEHRKHHAYTDSDQDPYSIKKGFMFAHIGWILLKEQPESLENYPKDLTKDPLMVWQHKHFYVLASFMAFILPGLLGLAMGYPLGGLAYMVFGKTVFLHHSTFFVNSLAHTLGKQTYSNKISAKDNIIVALLTFGEGYHNYHHTFQTDYRNGIKWYHYDPTKWFIQILAKLNLVWDLKQISDEEILKAKITGQENRLMALLKQKYQQYQENHPQGEKWEKLEIFLSELKEQIHQKIKNIQELKREYRQVKQDMTEQGQLKLQELKYQIKMKKLELKASIQRWQLSVKTIQRYGMAMSFPQLN